MVVRGNFPPLGFHALLPLVFVYYDEALVIHPNQHAVTLDAFAGFDGVLSIANRFAIDLLDDIATP
jgi:hypothetical protein